MTSKWQQGMPSFDSLLKWTISAIGIGTILAVLAIVFVIALEALPLFSGNSLTPLGQLSTEKPIVMAKLDPWFKRAMVLSEDGEILVHDIDEPQHIERLNLPSRGQRISDLEEGSGPYATVLWDDRRLSRIKLEFKTVFNQNGQRKVAFQKSISSEDCDFNEAISTGLSRKNEDGLTFFAAISKTGNLKVHCRFRQQNFLGQDRLEQHAFEKKCDGSFQFIAANKNGSFLYSFSSTGILEFWNVHKNSLSSRGFSNVDLQHRKATELTAMIGTDEVAIAFDNGDIEVFSLSSLDGGHLQPVRIHQQRVSDAAITTMVSSPRNRSLFVIDSHGKFTCWYSTHESKLKESHGHGSVNHISVSSRGKGLSFLHDPNKLSLWHWDAPHPEGGFKAFFYKLWYAGYANPEYAWQSSAGSNDFEAKLSLVPLFFGTLKGATFAMLFSVPISVFAALYTVIFATSQIRSIVKPIVEMMSAIPSVVIGFLGALCLAPLIDRHLFPLALSIPLALIALASLPKILGKSRGKDAMMMRPLVLLLMSAVALSMSLWLAFSAGDHLEHLLFEDTARDWLTKALGGRYDIRNSLVISIALGFAVIPIVYTISEDALANVPKDQLSASLALGASPWQTAWRIALPAASPGIFAAITLGFGRAVGETMIVLMATGNTPIMSVNIFEGFRSLAANIAIESPEAPVGGTLYRTLFFSAGLLLAFTSVLNAISETVRQRLARVYSKR